MNKYSMVILVVMAMLLVNCATLNQKAGSVEPQKTFVFDWPKTGSPNEVQITFPNPYIADDLKAIVGKMKAGRWGKKTCHSDDGVDAGFVVEKVLDKDNAVITYGWGDSPEWHFEKGWAKFPVSIKRENGTIKLYWTARNESRSKAEFTFEKDGTVSGKFDDAETVMIPYGKTN